MARPDNFLLQFVGAAVNHEGPLRSEDDAVGQGGGAVEGRVVRACQDFFASAVPRLVDALAAKFQDVLAAQARAQQDALAQMQVAASQLSSVRPVVNIISSPRGGLDALEHANLDAPEDDGAAAARSRAHPKLEGKDAIKHAIMTDARLSCTTTTDTGEYRGWICGRFRHKVSDLGNAIRQAADELAEVGLLKEDREAKKRGRRVQFYRKVTWGDLTEDAKNEAARLQVPRSAFD
jgi:hypothetical protein